MGRSPLPFQFHNGSVNRSTFALSIASFGLLVPNSLFIYWLLHEGSWQELLANKLALAFMIDALLVLIAMSYYFAQRPIGPVKWTWFVALSFMGGLGFSVPVYWWLNQRRAAR